MRLLGEDLDAVIARVRMVEHREVLSLSADRAAQLLGALRQAAAQLGEPVPPIVGPATEALRAWAIDLNATLPRG
jgi:hypothetical protein